MIVVDTNVVSELMRATPATEVTAWIREQMADELYTTAVTVAEIGYGIERLPDGRRSQVLGAAAEDIFSTFANRVLPFDLGAGRAYGGVVTRRQRVGDPISGFDAQIAAICLFRRARLATRNGRDFRSLDLDVIDPWQDRSG